MIENLNFIAESSQKFLLDSYISSGARKVPGTIDAAPSGGLTELARCVDLKT
jgi:hypothetical protein